MTDLQHRHVLVVGASGGLGSAIARELAAAGAVLTLSGRRADVLEALAAELGSSVVRTVTADLREAGAALGIVKRATAGQADSDTGPADSKVLDGVVYAAGVVAFGTIAELTDDVLDEVVLTNFIAPVRLIRAALPVLADGAFVLNLSAIVAELPTAGMAAYSATKAALTAFDKAAANELRRRGVRVIDARPPHTETGLATRPISGTPPRLPAGLEPREVAARAVRAILSDERDLPSAAFTTSST